MLSIMPNALAECETDMGYLVLTTLDTYKWLCSQGESSP